MSLSKPSASSAPNGMGSKVTKRLHVSPLNPAVHTADAVRSLLAPHADKVTVSYWPPSLNAVGEPRNYAYATLNGSEEQIKKAMSRISGSLWKGTKVWLREAKRDYKGGYGSQDEGSLKRHGGMSLQEEKEKKRTRKRSRSGKREHATINNVVTEEDVKAGRVWGWKMTPQGHLLRPIEMRPEKPISAPSHQSKAKSGKKTAGQGVTPHLPPSRAKRRLLDPTRYGAEHMVEGELEHPDLSASHEVWVCEDESEDSGLVRWVRQDGDGSEEVKVRRAEPRTEVAQANGTHPGAQKRLPMHNDEAEGSSLSSSSSSDPSSGSDESDSESVSDLDFASSRMAHNEDESLFDRHPENSNHSETDMHPGSFAFERYDPDDDANFSDGYDEAVGGPSTKASHDEAGDETQRGMDMLKDMFGNGLKSSASRAQQQDDRLVAGQETEEESEGDDQWWKKPVQRQSGTKQNRDAAKRTAESAPGGKVDSQSVAKAPVEKPLGPKAQAEAEKKVASPSPPPADPVLVSSAAPAPALSKRAALLEKMRAAASSSSAPTNQRTGFQPFERFEPGEVTMTEQPEEKAEPVAKPTEVTQPLPADANQNVDGADSNAPAAPIPVGDQVKMGSLKDMFKPQEGSGGFSLMGSMLLGDEELESEEEAEEPEPVADDADQQRMPGTSVHQREVPDRQLPVTSSIESPHEMPFFFPRFDSHPRDPIQRILSSGAAHTNGHSGSNDEDVLMNFLRPDSEEELQRRWEKRKSELTQDYKRRHREAVKKKKRKVVGAVVGRRGG